MHKTARRSSEEASVTREQLDAVLKFLPLFERKGARFVGKPGRSTESKGVVTIELPENSRDVDRFQSAAYENHLVVTNWDWGKWQSTAEGYYKTPSRLKRASLLTVRRLLTVHLRKEHFCSGHLVDMLEQGHIQAILRRLGELRTQLEPAKGARAAKK